MGVISETRLILGQILGLDSEECTPLFPNFWRHATSNHSWLQLLCVSHHPPRYLLSLGLLNDIVVS
jgi:hypothetical protein